MRKANEKTYAQQFLAVFKSLCRTRNSGQAWRDFILMSACTISNAVDKEMYDQREEMYMRTVKGYTKNELDIVAQLFALTVQALEEDPEQDFLGEIFTVLELCDKKKGQIFTPYPIAKLMALSTCGNLTEQIKEKGFVNVNDPCCGSGMMLIAFSNVAREQGVNYQRNIVFVAQDIDLTVALTCYIQLSLLGCVGYVVIGNTMSPEPPSRENIWNLPMNQFHRNLLEDFYHST
ncbi:MAG: N-6 DNA methylase [Firmicutes bacterium]|nr:N-6 DNA methylase [Bacillota bacterium]